MLKPVYGYFKPVYCGLQIEACMSLACILWPAYLKPVYFEPS